MILISAFISSIYLILQNNKYEKFYNNFNQASITAIVVSEKKETEYKNIYEVKLEEDPNIKFLLRISKNKNIQLNYADKIKVEGEYIVPEQSRNYGGFDYKQYLKTESIYGIFEAERIELIESNIFVGIAKYANNIKQKIIYNINKILPQNTKELFLGILIGYDDNLSGDIEESFRKSSLTHLLAVSGAHIVYIINGLGNSFKVSRVPKIVSNIVTIFFLLFFMYIVDFSASVVRASIMGIILLLSLILYKKNDLMNTISISIILILIENPYKILNIGLLLSYFATIGIICCSKILNKNKREEEISISRKIFNYIKELVLVTLYANIFVLPITLYNFNTLSLNFIISNLIAGILIGPITIGGFILIIVSFLNIKLAYLIGIPYNLLLELLINSTKIVSSIPFSEIFVSTPNIIFIIIYYLILFLTMFYLNLQKNKNKRYLSKKVAIYIRFLFKYLKHDYTYIIFLIIFIILILSILKIIPKDLKIYFIDVGQGDSTLVITPTNKKILIDGGGSETGSFDVGKSTLFPYLLDRGITSIDYICISHFDSDHCGGFKYLLENMKIKNIIISKQNESTSNFEEIISIAKEKRINILSVVEGGIINIDKYVKFKILSPGKTLTNDINDNSIVMKLEYINFSCLFTGDISQEVEENLVKKYGNDLKSTILKVAHHRFKEFITGTIFKTSKS